MSYILVVDAANEMRRSLSLLLQREGHQVREEVDSGGAVACVMEKKPKAIVLAEETAPMEGVEPLPLIRRLTKAPIVVIGGGGEEAVIKALLDGADMYVTRPVNFQELLSRIRALSRRAGEEPDSRSRALVIVLSPAKGLAGMAKVAIRSWTQGSVRAAEAIAALSSSSAAFAPTVA